MRWEKNTKWDFYLKWCFGKFWAVVFLCALARKKAEFSAQNGDLVDVENDFLRSS